MTAIRTRITVRRETRPDKSENDRWEKRDQSINYVTPHITREFGLPMVPPMVSVTRLLPSKGSSIVPFRSSLLA